MCERLTEFKYEVRRKLEQVCAACLNVTQCSNMLTVEDMQEVL